MENQHQEPEKRLFLFSFKSLVIFMGAFVLLAIIFDINPYDETDDMISKTRSGMILYTDYGTGCQYLSTGSIFSRTLTPRLGSDGKQVCKK